MNQKPQPGKRLFDLAIAIPALCCFAPLILVTGIAVFFSMGRPVMFRQRRPGLGGQPFTCLKFRTMTDARDESGKLKSDLERLTLVGRILRKTSLDELPQLWNVIRGDMSLVGPRPLLMEYLPNYTPEQARRHDVPPGITGWAQVNGRNAVSFSERLRLDTWYVDHWSLGFDLRIIGLTLLAITDRSGVRHDQQLEEVDDLGLHPETRRKAAATKPAQPAGSMRVISAADDADWSRIVEQTEHDFYHTAGYHRVAESQGEGEARLFVYEEDGAVIALPLLLREIESAERPGWRDATSIYGYGGPVVNAAALSPQMFERFRAALQARFAAERLVAIFSRLHPLLPQQDILGGLGEIRAASKTVSIDLTLPPEAQRAQYSASYRTKINKLRRMGAVCFIDEEKRHLAEFTEIYHETMRRVNAADLYFFSAEYFSELSRELGSMLKLFVVKMEDRVIAAALFTLCRGIVQYHLSGTDTTALRYSPMTFIVDSVREWAVGQGAHTLHLGGGVGSREDSLFTYKAGFSEKRHQFETWRWIAEPEIYAELTEHRRRLDESRGLGPANPDYFPAYRAPAARPTETPATELLPGVSENA